MNRVLEEGMPLSTSVSWKISVNLFLWCQFNCKNFRDESIPRPWVPLQNNTLKEKYVSTWTNLSFERGALALKDLIDTKFILNESEATFPKKFWLPSFFVCGIGLYQRSAFNTWRLLLLNHNNGWISRIHLTSVPWKSIPSAAVIHYCAWYTFLRHRM